MPHSLRAKLSGLHYKGILEDKDYKRLCHALDLEKAEQEQKSGKWIEKEFRKEEYVLTGKCSVCGRVRVIDDFCSCCGAKMESGDK